MPILPRPIRRLRLHLSLRREEELRPAMSVARKGTSLHLRKPFHEALRLLKDKYGASATQVFEALLERDLLENEPEIAQEVGIERKPPNRFAGGCSTGNMTAGSFNFPQNFEMPPVAGPTSVWGIPPNVPLPAPMSPQAEVPPSQRVR